MTGPSQPQWWVVFREPNPAEMHVVRVEPAPADDDAHDRRCAELEQSGNRPYVITAPDRDTAGDIAMAAWHEELITDPRRLAAANAFLASQTPTE
jgi:hypothetical protein